MVILLDLYVFPAAHHHKLILLIFSYIKPIFNHEYSYRLRVGRYRVFFEFTREIKIIRIEEVKKRDEHTY